MLRLMSVSYKTPSPRNLEVLNNITFSAGVKEHSIIYGDNGSGKTTMVKLLLKLIKADSGYIDCPDGDLIAVFEDIESQLIFSSVKEEIESTGRDMVNDEIISDLGIEEFKDKSTLELSYSQKARVVFAVSYLSGKEYMILDSLPPDNKINSVISKIAEKNLRTVILFMPLDDKRNYPGFWKTYLLKKSRLNNYNEN